MDDVPEGGGAATGNPIVDGKMNNVFEDISDTDRAYGRFNLRKMFIGVRTLDTATFGGVKSVITALPDDDAISYVLFSTDDNFDTRTEAKDKVEAYLYKSTTWQGYLNENHIAGMTAISVIQKVGSELPPIGKTLCLVQDEGLPTEKEQYVRVIDVSASEVEFSDEKDNTYTRLIVTMTLSDALRFNFNGHTVARNDGEYSYTNKTRIRDTRVADATRYYASKLLKESASVNDLTIKADGMFASLVPSAQTETPLVNKTLSPVVSPMEATAADPITITMAGAAFSPTGRFVAPSGIMPGSLSVTIGGALVTDDGEGNAIYQGSAVGQVVYDTGEVIFSAGAPTVSGTASLTYLPAAQVSQQAHTKKYDVTAENRRLNWTDTLLPVPAPKTLTVSYMAQGNWYVLQDDGNGNLTASDPSLGAGTISYVTGAVLVSLGALPDAGSQIMLSFASPTHYVIRNTTNGIDVLREMRFDLGRPVKPSSFTLTWTSGEAEKTATADAAGIISGDADGFINYALGAFTITTAFYPDDDTYFHVAATENAQKTVIKTGLSAPGGVVSISLGESIVAGSLVCEWDTQSTKKTDSVTTIYNYEYEVE